MNDIYKILVRPLFFRMNAEKAHEVASSLLSCIEKFPLLRKAIETFVNTPSQPTNVFGINFPNKIGLAAGFDKNGNLISYYTASKLGFKGSQKTKKYTLITILKNFIYNLNYLNNTTVIVKFKGITRNQNLIVKKLKEKLFIKAIIYNNLLPHNGCRPKKIRRK